MHDAGAVPAPHAAFEALWPRSLARRVRRPHLDDDLVLDLLAQGRTDASAARARSRYELGLAVASGSHAARTADGGTTGP